MNTEGIEDYPEFKKEAFYCPHCAAYAAQSWREWKHNYMKFGIHNCLCWEAVCAKCGSSSLWLDDMEETLTTGKEVGFLIFPPSIQNPLSSDASSAVREVYDEAAAISTISPRAATALLRLAIDTLCVEILGKRENLNAMIEEIAKKNAFSLEAIDAMHTLRLLGNQAIHPGEINLTDGSSPKVLFWLVQYIVAQAITQHKTAKKINQEARESARKSEKKPELEPSSQPASLGGDQ